ncbi:nuclear transport factor 2 family protein [Vibrio makurazakiensis]|uniref:nuclear transport factor 2 family protein n=1 Tax=Vibrio makurazakiensis TaxID=2910250 RepID=UPI003D0F3CA1
MQELDEIVATLEDYAKAYCAKDIDALMLVFDSNENISVIGTGEDELCSGIQSVKKLFLRNFSEASATQFEWGWSDIVVSDKCAVVSQCLTIHLKTEQGAICVPIRWTVVLKKTDRWVWLHRHASTASSAQVKGQAYPES